MPKPKPIFCNIGDVGLVLTRTAAGGGPGCSKNPFFCWCWMMSWPKKGKQAPKGFKMFHVFPLLVSANWSTQALDVDVLTALRWVAIATVSLLAVIFPLLAQRLTLLKAPATAEELVDLAMKHLDLFTS